MPPKIEINLVHDLGFKPKKPAFYEVRKGFLRVWVLSLVIAVGGLIYTQPSALYNTLESNIALLDKYYLNVNGEDYTAVSNYVLPTSHQEVAVEPMTDFPVEEPTDKGAVLGETVVQGPKGDKGDTGAQGPQGPQGPQGIAGPAGTATIAPYAPIQEGAQGTVTSVYIPGGIVQPNPAQNFNGAILFSATDLSSHNLTSDIGKFNTSLAVTGSSNLSGDLTASGTIVFSNLGGSGTKCIQTDNSGVITAAAAACGSGGSGGITIGTTTITSGSSGNILYNNAGVVGEMTTTGSGTVLVLSTSPSITTPTFVTSATSPLFTNAGAMSLTTTASNGNISLAPNGTGSIVLTSGATTGTMTSSALSLAVSSLTTGTGLYAAAGNSLTSGKLVDLQVSSTGSLTGQTALNILTSGANGTGSQTTYGIQVANTHTGTSTNVGLYASATGGTNNYAAIFNNGDVGIGTKLPNAALTLSRSGSDASITSYSSTDTNWQGSYFATRRSRGTIDSPTDVLSGDYLNILNAQAYANSNYQFAGSAGFYVEGSPVGSNVPTMYVLWLSDSTGSAERLRVTSTGLMGLGTSDPAKQLEINSATGNNLRLTYNDSDGSATNYSDLLTDSSGNLTITPSGANITITGNAATISADLGNGNAGYILTLGRNNNATNTGAGSINFQSKAGTAGYVWQDNAGNMRVNTSAPSNANDTSGIVIGDQTSTRNTKQDITDYTDYGAALQMVTEAPLHTFRYIKDVQGYGQDSPLAKARIGYIADEVPGAFMWGNSIDQVSVNGILMASVKALNNKIDILTAELQNQSSNSSLAFGQPNLAGTPIILAYQLYLSGDNVGQAKILPGSTSVRVAFSKPYQYQPIVTTTPNSRVGSEFWVSDKDSTGFTLNIELPSIDEIVFDWHSFAGPSEQLTVSDGTQTDIILVLGLNNDNNVSVEESAIAPVDSSSDSGTATGDSTITPDTEITPVVPPVPYFDPRT